MRNSFLNPFDPNLHVAHRSGSPKYGCNKVAFYYLLRQLKWKGIPHLLVDFRLSNILKSWFFLPRLLPRPYSESYNILPPSSYAVFCLRKLFFYIQPQTQVVDFSFLFFYLFYTTLNLHCYFLYFFLHFRYFFCSPYMCLRRFLLPHRAHMKARELPGPVLPRRLSDFILFASILLIWLNGLVGGEGVVIYNFSPLATG